MIKYPLTKQSYLDAKSTIKSLTKEITELKRARKHHARLFNLYRNDADRGRIITLTRSYNNKLLILNLYFSLVFAMKEAKKGNN